MGLFDVIFIAVGLAMDALAVAVAVGLHLSAQGSISGRQYFRISFHFGFFQFLMPIVGWLAGTTVAHYIEAIDHWVAAGLLAYIGIKLIREAGEERNYRRLDPSRGISLIMLSTAVSIDALATGLSLAILDTGIIYPAIIIGVVASAFALAGMLAGKRIGPLWRKRVAWLGGLILISIGIKILIEHLG